MKQFCPQCNKWIDSNTRKCPECGMIMYAEGEYTQKAQHDNISAAGDITRADSAFDNSNAEKSPENRSSEKDDQNSMPDPSNGYLAQSTISDLKIDVGILGIKGCSRDENKKYTEMLKNGQPLPDDLIKREYDDGSFSFLHTFTKVPPNEEEKYI
ncbi:MAG: hypothetical protein K2N36_02320, partial [Ruminiclostridium sp.]|nr:hypothetical protein [Ruminiclostridium sp.]